MRARSNKKQVAIVTGASSGMGLGIAMRLPLLPSCSLLCEQKELYDDIMGVVNQSFGSFVAMRQDGALIRPFNAMLHFPAFGRAAWAMNKTMYEHTTLPKSVLQVAVLVTGTRLGVLEKTYGSRQ